MTKTTKNQTDGRNCGRNHSWRLSELLALLGLILCLSQTHAQNLLYNGGFEIAGPAGWQNWNQGGGVDYKNDNYGGHSSWYVNIWGGTWGNMGGWYQTVSATSGATYTLTVESATENWWNPEGKIGMVFKDAAGTTLQTVELIVANYTAGLPWTTYSLTNTAPANTATVTVDLKFYGGGAVLFDNAVLQSSVAYPSIANVYPDGIVLMQPTNKLAFTATSGAAITNIQVLLNGVEVPLEVTGSPTSKSVTYTGLKTNLSYTGSITIKDENNLSTSVPIRFDTFSPVFVWEAEDFDYSNGLYINNPVLSSAPAAGSYFGVIGTQNIDENDIGHNGPQLYRTNDYMATAVSADTTRQNILVAQASDPNIRDYNIGYFDNNEWVNYTRMFPAGKYNVYARLASGNAGITSISLSKVTSGQGTETQTTAPLGTFKFTGTAWNSYQYVVLSDAYGNPVALDLNGLNTLRVTGGGANMNFFLIVPARLDVPLIANVYPNGSVLLQPTNKLAFTVSSPVATIPSENIQVTLDGQDVTSSLLITGTSTSKSVSFTGLRTNATYTAAINVVDANGISASSTFQFDTYQALFLWEAEDWDYDAGQYINNPVPTPAAAPNSYFGRLGQQGIDENETGTDPDNLYRAGDKMHAGPCGDVTRQIFVDAKVSDPAVQDWNAGYFDSGEWINYTRQFPAGTYNVYARVANGNSGTASVGFSQVTGGQGTSSQTTASLGSFQFPALGWGAYRYVPLRDRFGNLTEVTLNGLATLRAGGGANVNFFMLATPRNDLPRITNVYPDGTLQLQATNKFAFTASNPTVPIYSTNIAVTLNGQDVTSQLTLSGSENSWSVSLPLALNVARYTAVITVRDANTNLATTTIYFDTFSPASFTWEAEDYDYNSGSFIDNPVPTSAPAANSYFGLDSTYGVDYSYDVSDPATPYTNYWRFSLGIDVCGDFPPLAKHVTARLTDPNVRDYNLAWWTSNSWANYTRTFPAGTYQIYARMASGTGGAVVVDRITSGTAARIGQFNLSNWGWGIYSWWPMVDANGQPVTVTFNGPTTLRMTTDGSANANRFVLVTPLSAIAQPQITATLSSGSILLSFPSQTGRLYQVWSRENLPDAGWTLRGAVAGDGSTKSWSEPALGAHRFYRLVVQ